MGWYLSTPVSLSWFSGNGKYKAFYLKVNFFIKKEGRDRGWREGEREKERERKRDKGRKKGKKKRVKEKDRRGGMTPVA